MHNVESYREHDRVCRGLIVGLVGGLEQQVQLPPTEKLPNGIVCLQEEAIELAQQTIDDYQAVITENQRCLEQMQSWLDQHNKG